MAGRKKAQITQAPSRPLPAAVQRVGNRDPSHETFELAHGEFEYFRAGRRVATYRMGERLNTIKALRLYEQGGFRTFTEYLQAIPGASRSSLYVAMKLTALVSHEVAAALDPERIDAIYALLPRATTKAGIVSLRALNALKVKVWRHGEPTTTTIAGASTEELEDAVRRLRASRQEVEIPAHVARERERVSRKLGRGASACGDLRIVKVGGTLQYSFLVPVDRLDEFEKAIGTRVS